MIKSIITLLLSGFLLLPVSGFTANEPFPDKVVGAVVIARGVVVRIIQLTTEITNSRGRSAEKTMDEAFSGPHAIALFRVTDTLKGELKSNGGIILVPCGYSFDESPAELTDTKEYVLFLKDMGRNYYHPTTAYSSYRVQAGRVGNSGFDTETDFEPKEIQKETQPVEEFIKQIKSAMVAKGSE